ncbi:MAG TPA: DNA-processing protein DprA, partial [Limnochordia bacterium]|nr:DNA-processing protein DprA [Limnochordia bacterium]
IAVLAGGLDEIYPPENRPLADAIARRGLLLAEAPPGVREERFRFPIRNRIIAGLSRAVVVVEAPYKSGALQTAGLALDLGRDVYAMPADVGRWSAGGSNRLLVETQVALDGLDVLGGTFRELRAAPVAAARDGGEPGRALDHGVLAALAAGPMTLEALQLAVSAERGKLFTAVTRLELAGRIVRLGPQTYAKAGL